MMKILREVRWKFPIPRATAFALITVYWLQFLVVQLPPEHSRLHLILFLHELLAVISNLSKQLVFVALHLGVMLVLGLWALQLQFQWCHLERIVKVLIPLGAYTVKAYPFVLQIVVLDLSVDGMLRRQSLLEVILAGLNALSAVGLTLVCNFINLTMQFNETDFLSMRKFDLSTTLLQIGIIVCNSALPQQSRVVLLALNVCMASLAIFQQFQKYEYELARRLSLFFNLLMALASMCLGIYQATTVPLNSTKVLFVLVFSAGVAHLLAEQLNQFVKYRLPTRLAKSNEVEQLIRQYQLAKQQHGSQKGRLGYLFYNIIVQHYNKCANSECRCHKRRFLEDLTPRYQEEVFILENLRIMSDALASISNASEVRLLQIYFYLEVAKEPIKAYYEIIRLKREKITFKTRTQLERMIEMAKLCFAQIFKKNNVQNQELELMKLIDYQESIEQLEAIILDAVGRNIQFLKLFTYNSVKISDVEDHTSEIERVKNQCESLLDQLAAVNCESKSLNLFNFIFYRYVEFYRSRRLEFEKLKSQEQIKKRLFEKSEVDVFSSEHGTIYIDLIEERGKILKITRNVCSMFGYPKNEMMEMNIDGYMPSIFARCHDRFLCNFIEKGEITLLKEKQRIIFGKNKKHFIFPFNIRLKVENTNEGAFGACALLTKLSINKEYILFSKKGCIDEMSEGIYRRIFEPLLQADVGRVRRLNIMKIMPCLNMLVELAADKQAELLQGLVFMPLEFNELMKFRYHRSIENEGNEAFDNASDKFDRASFNGTNQMSLDSRRGEKTDTRYLESFKSLITQIDILQLRGFRLSYRLSEIVTNYFEAKIMEIEHVKEVPIDKKFFLNLIEEFRGIAAFFEINDEFSPWINKLNTLEKVINHFSLAHLLKVRNGPNLVSEYEQFISNSEARRDSDSEESSEHNGQPSDGEEAQNDSECDEQVNESQTEQQNNEEAGLVIRGNSEQSSMLGNEQHESKKQMIIDAFSKDRSHGIPMSMVVFGVTAFALILLTMAGMFVFSYVVVVNEREEWRGGFFLMKVSQTLVYHTALTEISQFYSLNSNQAMLLEFQKWAASESLLFKDLFRSLTEEMLDVDFARRSNYLKRTIDLHDPRTNASMSLNFFNLLHQLDTVMSEGSSRYNLIEHNQIVIRQRLEELISEDILHREAVAQQLRLVSLVLFVVAEFLLFLVAIVAIPIYNYFRERRMFLLRLLGYFNTRDIRKAMAAMKILQECLMIPNENERADRILNQMQAKKNYSASLRNTVEQEREEQKGKALKLSFQGLRDPKKQFACVALLAVLALSTYPTALFGYNYTQQTAIESTSTYESKLFGFENAVPALLGNVFTNVNRKMQTQGLLNLPPNLDREGFFSLVNFFAGDSWTDLKRRQLLSDLLMKDICATLQLGDECSSLYGGILTKGYFYAMLMFRDKLTFLVQSNQNLTTTGIQQWTNENQILEFLKLLSFLRSSTLLANELLRENSLSFFDGYQRGLMWMAGVLTLFSLCCIWLLKRWFVTRLMEIIKGAEKIYLNFNINILTENTYLTSYFNEKVRVKL